MVDAVVTVFLEKLLTALTEESLIISEFKHEFKKLQNELQLMQSFLKDAERMKRKNETLRTIMACLRDLIYESEDILSDCEIRSSSSKTNGGECFFISPSEILFRYQTGKRLREINSKIINIKTNISSYLGVPLLLVQSNSSSTPTDMENSNMNRWSSHLYDHTRVVGLEEETKKIKDWLLLGGGGGGGGNHHHHHEISSPIAIGVVGMGGVGKTTTAQKVFNDREIEDYFERKIWVSVSQTFSDEQIMRSMLRSLGDSSVGDDSSELLRKINQYLQGKRYLIVMDDVWREDDSWWRQISEGLPKGNSSSGNSFIIITTRIEKVARRMGVTEEWTHRPKLLSKADSWLLFRRIAFAASGGECVYPELVSVGMEIVEKCKGLPLTIKAVGGMMLCKLPYFNEWKRIAGNFRDELAENDNQVMASLQLSYDELPSYLKSCFLCFSLYPEDCVITKEQLIHWWIGEGFVPVRNGRLATEAAEDCFSGLMNRCLIDVVDKNHNGKIYTCKMHDMVRDLVIRLAEECAFSSSNGKNSRHLGLKNDMESQSHRNNLKLRALLSTTKTGEVNKVNSSIAKEFCKYKYLRVLDISKSIFEEHLTSLLERIGSLQHLTYLCFSSTHPLIQVPHSVERLINLQILDVSYCQNLKTLPSYIPNMEKLIVLDISHCGSLEYLPKGLGRLSKLQALIGFKPARPNQADGCRLSELKSMTQLRTLELRLTRGDEIGDDETNVLLHLQQLQFLTINCFDSHEGELVTKLDQLCPPQQLHDICLKFFPGEISPTWLNPISLPMLRYLSISSGNLAKMNQRFWGNENMVWKVEGLMLDSISDLQEEWVTVQRAMPLLRVVSSCWCPQLESFPIEEIGFRGGVWRKEDKGREVKEIHQ